MSDRSTQSLWSRTLATVRGVAGSLRSAAARGLDTLGLRGLAESVGLAPTAPPTEETVRTSSGRELPREVAEELRREREELVRQYEERERQLQRELERAAARAAREARQRGDLRQLAPLEPIPDSVLTQVLRTQRRRRAYVVEVALGTLEDGVSSRRHVTVSTNEDLSPFEALAQAEASAERYGMEILESHLVQVYSQGAPDA